MASDSARYDEATNVRPKGTCKSMEGSVIDGRKKYPSTIDFVKPSPKERSAARRPGGALRRGHGFKSTACTCGGHPCKCGTSTAKEHIIHCNINE